MGPDAPFPANSLLGTESSAGDSEEVRGGTGILEVVRPLQIKDHFCMWEGGGGGGWGEGGSTTGNVRQ